MATHTPLEKFAKAPLYTRMVSGRNYGDVLYVALLSSFSVARVSDRDGRHLLSS